MSKKKTTEDFIIEARSVHGNKYDYSKVEYVNCKAKVIVVCPKHGEFLVTPDNHIRGRGCPVCRYVREKVVIDGFVNDDEFTKTTEQSYKTWKSMIVRCYSEKARLKHKAYSDVLICEDWHKFSNFKEWFDEHYVEGWQLDKDILIKGNKEYAPDKCCFVPSEINSIFGRNSAVRGKYPIGVSLHKKLNKLRVDLSTKEKRNYLGLFDNVQEAFEAYKKAKEQRIKHVADKYIEKLEPRVYEALYNYKIEITD